MFLLLFPDRVRTDYWANCPKKSFSHLTVRKDCHFKLLFFLCFLFWKRNILTFQTYFLRQVGSKRSCLREEATPGSEKLFPLPLLTLFSTSSVTRLIFSLVSSVKMFSWFRTKSSLSFWSSRSSMDWTLTRQKGDHHHHHAFPQERNRPLSRHGPPWWVREQPGGIPSDTGCPKQRPCSRRAAHDSFMCTSIQRLCWTNTTQNWNFESELLSLYYHIITTKKGVGNRRPLITHLPWFKKG